MVSTWARSKRAARSECANARQSEPSATFGSIACFCASLPHSAIRPAPITTVDEIGLGDQAAPEGFHHDAGLDRAGAEPAIVFRNRQRQPAEFGELFPDRGTEAERIARAAAAVIGVIGFRNEAVDTFAQQPLLVAEVEVHLIYFTAAVFLTEGCSPAGSTTMPNSCRLCA